MSSEDNNSSENQSMEVSQAPISTAGAPTGGPETNSNLEGQVSSTTLQPADGSTARKGRTIAIRHRTFVIVGACLLVISLGGWLMRPHTVRELHVVSIRQLTDDGHQKGNLLSDDNILYFNLMEGAHLVLKSAPASGSPIHSIETPSPM